MTAQVDIPNEPSELVYIEPFFQTLNPKATPLVGRTGLRFVCDPGPWKDAIGRVTGTNAKSIKRRAKYRLFKSLEERRLITFCKDCGTIMGSRVIDGFNRPWENLCADCFSSNSK